jgi:hypothetical protein
MKLSRLASLVVAGGLVFLAVGPYHSTAAAQGTPAKTASTGKIDLRPRFRVGQETRFKMEMDSTGDQKATVGATILLKCLETNPETGSTLEVSFETLKLKMNGVDFDSSKPSKSEDGMDDLIRPLIGTKLSMKMDKEGNITSFDGGMGGLGDQMGGADIFKGMFGSLSTSKKGTGQASVGEKWTNEDTMEAGMGTVRITTTNTLKSATGTTALVDLTGKFSLDPSSGKNVTIRDCSLNGEFRWNTELGMLDSLQVKKKLTVEQRQDKGPPTHTTMEVNERVTRISGGEKGTAPTPAPAPKTAPMPPKEWDPSKK